MQSSKNILLLIESMRNIQLKNHRGESVRLETCGGVEPLRQRAFESEWNIVLPNDLSAILRLSNGVNLFGVHIGGIDELLPIYDGLVVFHSWGNGDVTCIQCGQAAQYQAGEIVFIGHDPPLEGRVSNCLSAWIDGVARDIEATGRLLHPSEYPFGKFIGLYAALAPRRKKP